MNQLSPIFALLSLAALPALADDGAVGMMPDGSTDMYVGLAIASRLSSVDDHEPSTALRPLLQVQWSNGIFVSASGVVGMHLSHTPGVEYGPLLLDSNGREPGDNRRLANTHSIKGSWDAGGFYNYYLGWRVRLLTSAAYDTSAGGLAGSVGLQKTLASVAPHHTITFSAGATLGSGAVMRERYEVFGAYRPSGGVMAVNAGANWNWELSSRWLINTAVSAQRLGNEPAASPIVGRRNVVTWSSGLAYRF
ncbi:MipA/OmpV family protein [Oxalobacteraceae bacterium OTU3CINTB1]|nr:MipA/OmpV family protein [Oxalobacteraceae bacterium OTU3CINTB1]